MVHRPFIGGRNQVHEVLLRPFRLENRLRFIAITQRENIDVLDRIRRARKTPEEGWIRAGNL